METFVHGNIIFAFVGQIYWNYTKCTLCTSRWI